MDSFKGQALNDVVIVREVAIENKTSGGLDTSNIVDKNEKYREGVVVSIGINFKDGRPLPVDKEGNPFVKVGDTVVYDKLKATDFTQDGITYKSFYYCDLFKKN